MKLKGLIEEDFIQYKKPSMFLICPYCTFKCDKENGNQVCQNWALRNSLIIDYPVKKLVERYLANDITKAVVFGGLEPFDTYPDVLSFIKEFRKYSEDDIVIYTGFTESEIVDKVEELVNYKNIIIKCGRYIPGEKPHRDLVLGVDLASHNQHGIKIS